MLGNLAANIFTYYTYLFLSVLIAEKDCTRSLVVLLST